MRDPSGTKQELLEENSFLKQRIKDLEQTERPQTGTERAWEGEVPLRACLENAPDGICMIDVKGNFVYGNCKSEEMIGCGKGELIGKNFLECGIFSEESLSKVTGFFQANLEGKATEPNEIELISKEGRLVPVEINTSVVQHMDQRIVLTFIRDITERKRAEEAHRASELRYQTIFETTGTTMLIVEEDMIISLVNNEFESLTGYTREEVEGKRKWTEFIEQSDLEKMIAQHKLRRAADQGLAAKSYEFRLIHRDGYIKHILLTVDLIPGTKKSVASLMDITDRKQAEDALLASEVRYRTIFENTGTANIIIAEDRTILMANLNPPPLSP
jgi:PAS domain S-box-containing protein